MSVLDKDGSRNYFGIPIEGDFTESSSVVEQDPDEEFHKAIKAMLDDPEIVDFGWQQYTPYFNDGDPCTFSACGAWVRTKQDIDDEYTEDEWPDDSYEFEVNSSHPTFGDRVWNDKTQSFETVVRKASPELAEKCDRFSSVVESGRHEILLQKIFGNHTEIRVTKTRIYQNEYEHH